MNYPILRAQSTTMVKLGLVDDHIIFRKALASFFGSLPDYRVVLEADNGNDLKRQLLNAIQADLIILDMHMPEMNGFDTAAFLLHQQPAIKILVVSMLPEKHHLEKLLQMGISGYVQKDADIEELQLAIQQIMQKGHYLNPGSYVHLLSERGSKENKEVMAAQLAAQLSDREKEFLRWLCTDKGYKEIAQEMFVSPRTIDGYRDNLLKKLKVNSRIGLVTFAIRQGIAAV